MISKVNIYNDKYYYKREEYDKWTLATLLNILKKKRKIILYSENIFIKSYKYIGSRVDNYVEEKIAEEFSNKDNILFHYEVDKKNKLIYLYSLRNDNFKEIYDEAEELSIEPIQFKVRDIILRRLGRNKNILVFYKIKNISTVIFIRKKFITEIIMSEEIKDIKKFIIEKRNDGDILVFNKEVNDLEEFKDIKINHFINLGVNKHENVYKK